MMKSQSLRRIFLASCILLTCCALVRGGGSAFGQSAGPQPLPLPPQIVAPRDTPYPGTIRLNVDATDIERHILGIHETIPVRAGEPIVLLYPRWLYGNHSGGAKLVSGL